MRHSAAGLICWLALLPAGAGDADAADERPVLEDARTRSIKFTRSLVVTQLANARDSTGAFVSNVTCRLGIGVANVTRDPVRVRLRLVSGDPTRADSAEVLVAPKHDVELSCAIATVIAGHDYPIDVAVFAEPSGALLETVATRVRVDDETLDVSEPKKAQREALCRSLPRTYEKLSVKGDSRGTPSLGKCSLTVASDALTFDGKQSLRVAAGDVAWATLRETPFTSFAVAPTLEVAYHEGGELRHLKLSVGPSLGDLFTRSSTHRLEEVALSIQELIDRRNRSAGFAATSSSAAPMTSRASVLPHEGIMFQGGTGLGMFAGRDDSLAYTRVGGVAFSTGLDAFVTRRLAVGVRAETMLGITAGLFLVPTHAFAGGDLQLWWSDAAMLGVGVGPAYSIVAGKGALGTPIRLAARVPAEGNFVNMIGIEYLPIWLKGSSAWYVGLDLQFARGLHRYKRAKQH